MNHEQIGKNLNHSDSRFAHDEQFRLRLLPCTNKYAYVISSSSERAQLLPPDAIGKLISLNGHKLRLKPVLQVSDTMIMGDSVKLQNATEDCKFNCRIVLPNFGSLCSRSIHIICSLITEDFARIVVNRIFDPFQLSWFQRAEIGSFRQKSAQNTVPILVAPRSRLLKGCA